MVNTTNYTAIYYIFEHTHGLLAHLALVHISRRLIVVAVRSHLRYLRQHAARRQLEVAEVGVVAIL